MGMQESKFEKSFEEEVPKDSPVKKETPSSPILGPLDPRSPSANIARTPLEVTLGRKISEKSGFILGVDPRSPTLEFNRTPIVIPTGEKEDSVKPLNKNLHNVLKSEIQTTPTAKGTTTPNSGCLNVEKKMQTEPKRRSLVGLLETNLDFTETDLDAVSQAKLNASLPVKVEEDLPVNNLIKQMSTLPTTFEETSPIEDLKPVNEKVINVTAQVKDFDKKLTNLIYEDEEQELQVNTKTCIMKDNNRTPLGTRNGNDDNKKSKLRVSDKPRKSDSKIPILKNQRRKLGIQCENTPPSSRQDVNKSHWDSDKTLII